MQYLFGTAEPSSDCPSCVPAQPATSVISTFRSHSMGSCIINDLLLLKRSSSISSSESCSQASSSGTWDGEKPKSISSTPDPKSMFKAPRTEGSQDCGFWVRTEDRGR